MPLAKLDVPRGFKGIGLGSHAQEEEEFQIQVGKTRCLAESSPAHFIGQRVLKLGQGWLDCFATASGRLVWPSVQLAPTSLQAGVVRGLCLHSLLRSLEVQQQIAGGFAVRNFPLWKCMRQQEASLSAYQLEQACPPFRAEALRPCCLSSCAGEHGPSRARKCCWLLFEWHPSLKVCSVRGYSRRFV